MRVVLIGAALLAGLYVLGMGALFVFQRRILYHPDTNRPDLSRAEIPGAREVTIETPDGLSLLAWYLPPVRPDGFVALHLHGNAGHIGHRAWRLAPFARLGWGVLMPGYRGFGGNPGRPSEAGLLIDARASLAAARAMGFSLDRILLWGESLGSGLAVRLAVDHEVAAVLLEAPYTSIAAMARLRYKFVPVDSLLLDRFDSLSIVGRVRAPVLVMHGALDQIIPLQMGRDLYRAAPDPKELWIAPGAGHVDLVEAGAIEAAGDFVSRLRPHELTDAAPASR
ncbi:MAG: alpha/beta hydrolase [Acetobacteraceae bacterium]|nr:alpha/beta hydrolase [Acetobacteraceae bacterium]